MPVGALDILLGVTLFNNIDILARDMDWKGNEYEKLMKWDKNTSSKEMG